MSSIKDIVVGGAYLIYLGWFVPHPLELLSVSNMTSGMTGVKQRSGEIQHHRLV